MKSNILLKIVAFIIVVILITLFVVGKDRTPKQANSNSVSDDLLAVENKPALEDNGLQLDPLESEHIESEYGVDIDSPEDTMRTLTEELRATRDNSKQALIENKKLKLEISRLLNMEKVLNDKLSKKFSTQSELSSQQQKEIQKEQSKTRKLIEEFEKQIKSLNQDIENKASSTAFGYDINSADIPEGLGYDDKGNEINFDEMLWINPLDADVETSGKVSLPDFSGFSNSARQLTNKVTDAVSPTDQDSNKEERSIKYYTIPDNGTLIGSVSMTAMLGRIPIGGQVTDPYPFKIIVGSENLSSNGIHIPGITGIIMSGYAKGDWTLSCVSGRINSMTFTFEDGTLVTIPENSTSKKSNSDTEGLAWFSDKNGVPCITGKRITNAPTYLSSRVGLTAAASYANAKAASQFTTQTNAAGGLTRGLTGDPTTVAKNSAISNGLNEVTDWLDERQANSFDAIYIPPGTQIAVHVTKELKIDYDPLGRKVNYYANSKRNTHSDLD